MHAQRSGAPRRLPHEVHRDVPERSGTLCTPDVGVGPGSRPRSITLSPKAETLHAPV